MMIDDDDFVRPNVAHIRLVAFNASKYPIHRNNYHFSFIHSVTPQNIISYLVYQQQILFGLCKVKKKISKQNICSYQSCAVIAVYSLKHENNAIPISFFISTKDAVRNVEKD